MTPNALYVQIAMVLDALRNAQASHNQDAILKRFNELRQLENFLPSGSGIDCGTKVDVDASRHDKIVLTFSFHFMNDNGYYDGWGDYKAIVMPSLAYGLNVKIVGRNRRDIKDYLFDTMHYALVNQRVDFDASQSRWFLVKNAKQTEQK